jgi:hypothetical protein
MRNRTAAGSIYYWNESNSAPLMKLYSADHSDRPRVCLRASWRGARRAQWSAGDYLHVATVVRPTRSEDSVRVKGLRNDGAAAAVEPDGRKA